METLSDERKGTKNNVDFWYEEKAVKIFVKRLKGYKMSTGDTIVLSGEQLDKLLGRHLISQQKDSK